MPLTLGTEPDEAAIQRIVADRIQEDLQVEYKEETYGGDDGSRRELLRDVSSMANAAGGILLIGVQADSEGVPVSLPGILMGQNCERIEQVLRSGLDPVIPGLRVQAAALANGREVVVITIPDSLVGPHLVTAGGLNQFWIRNGRTKSAMRQLDVVQHVLRIHSTVDSIDSAWESLRVRAQERFRRTPHFVIGAYPLPLNDGVEVDAPSARSAMTLSRGWARPDYLAGTYRGVPRPSLRGIRGEEGERVGWLEFSRSGALEFATLCASDDQRRIDCRDLLQAFYPFVLTAYRLGEAFALSQRLVIRAEVCGLSESDFKLEESIGHIWDVRWYESSLDLGELGTDRTEHDPYEVGDQFSNRLCRIFGEPVGVHISPP